MPSTPIIEPVELPSWMSETTCLACGGRREDVDPSWSDDEIRCLAVFESEDPSCGSSALAGAIRKRMADHAWVEAHRGCAVQCDSCGQPVPLLDRGDFIVRATDRTRSGSIRCSCGHQVSVVGVRARPYTPPIPKIVGLTWCGAGRPCASERCPLRGS